VEFSTDPAGEMVGKLLRSAGASVVKIEPPGGACSRRVPPFVRGDPSGESLHFLWYNAGKKFLTVESTSSGHDPALAELLAGADVVIHSERPEAAERRELDYKSIRAFNPRAIVCAITPFGQTGPWVHYSACDLTALAGAGMLLLCGYDDLTIAPVRPGGYQSYHVAATFAVNSILIAVLHRGVSGPGQFLDVSVHDAVAVSLDLANPYWSYPKATVHRQASRGAAPVPTQPAVFRAADGRWLQVNLMISEDQAWRRFVSWLRDGGLSVDLEEPSYEFPAFRREHAGHIYQILDAFVGLHPADQLFWTAQDHGVPAGVVYAPEELVTDPHLAARGFFAEVPLRDGGGVPFPKVPFEAGVGYAARFPHTGHADPD
jgi:crotonobetainyl-CoA:carnitine CoA-transferase CaiB-like acyl-CoA transferase